jgi:AAA domain
MPGDLFAGFYCMNTFDFLSPGGQPIFVTRLPNERGGGKPIQRYVRNETELQKFIADHDEPGYALYHAAAILKEGSWRNKDNVVATRKIWAEIDFKHHRDMSPEKIRQRIEAIPLKPTGVIFSGHGYHLYWLFKEDVDAAPGEGQRRVEDALKLAAAYVGGDPQVAETARLMRLPGSHNTRVPGEELPVLFDGVEMARVYDLDELVDFWLEAQPILPTPGAANKPNGDGHDASDGGDFTRDEQSTAETTDVDERLAAMRYEGPDGGGNVHVTQRDVTASLVGRGVLVDEAVAQVLVATKTMAAAKPLCANWNWAKEEDDIRRLCYGFVNRVMRENGEDLGHTLPDKLYDAWNRIIAQGNVPEIFHNPSGACVRRSKRNGTENKTDGAGETNGAAGGTEDGSAKPRAPFVLRPFAVFDPAKLPPREWLFGRHYQRGTVSGTVAPGGTGKSSLVMVEAISMATGRMLLDEEVKERLRVWFHSGEESMDELNRRVAAICQYYNIPLDELPGWFFMTSGNEVPLRVAKGYSNLLIDSRLIKCITEAIGDNKIDVASFDPLVTLHGVPENDTGKMDTVVRIFANIADNMNCGVELSHHTRKLLAGSTADYAVDDMRGAGSLKDAMRAVRMLNFMQKADAEAAGLGEYERTSYFRIDRVKANNSPPAKAATWRRFVNVELPNTDEVGVIAPWSFPGADGPPSPERAAAEQRVEHIFLELLARLTVAGRVVSERPGTNYAPSVFAKEREARLAKVSKVALADGMRRLFEKGKIRVEEYQHGGHARLRIVAT